MSDPLMEALNNPAYAIVEEGKPKRKGRPKGSKNKPKEEELIEIKDDLLLMPSAPWYDDHLPEQVTILLQSEHVQEGLRATVSRHVAVAVSELPNGNASVITSIGTAQPLILVTVEPYSKVAAAFFGKR